jgi:RIO kinase 1
MSFAHDEAMSALESFFDEGWVREVLFEVKSGKEATVYCCRAGERACALAPGESSLIAAKIYRPLESRRFKNDAMYQTGRMHLARESRYKRAAENKSEFGRKVQYATWLENEWETMQLLYAAGADVPQPLARNDRTILMTYAGDERSAAPKLADADLARNEVVVVTDRLLWNVGLMLDCDRVHGDLSPFNILHWQGRAIIIDFPQAIDPRLNTAALPLLSRDVEKICRWAAKHGDQREADRITQDLWQRFTLGEIG